MEFEYHTTALIPTGVRGLEPFDLALTDIVLPGGMIGLQLARALVGTEEAGAEL